VNTYKPEVVWSDGEWEAEDNNFCLGFIIQVQSRTLWSLMTDGVITSSVSMEDFILAKTVGTLV